MAAGDTQKSTRTYLLAQFREFFREVTILRAQALRGEIDGADAVGVDTADDAAEADASPPPLPWRGEGDGTVLRAEKALQHLQSVLELQALESGRRGGDYGVQYYREAQYVMAVLADEIFLNLDWSGRSAWKADLLETRLFGTYNAGEQFFTRLQNLLETGNQAQSELAIVYLLALSLGFKGRYRGVSSNSRLDEYRRQLFRYIAKRQPELMDEAMRLCPQAYDHTATEATIRWLPSPSRWYALLAASVVFYILVSHFVWSSMTSDLHDLLDRLT